MAIFAFVGTIAMSGYTQLAEAERIPEQRLERMREVQRAVQTLAQDLTQIEPRSIREPIGDPRMPGGARRGLGRVQAASSRAPAGATRPGSAGHAATRRLPARPGRSLARSLAGARPHAGLEPIARQAAGRGARRDFPLHDADNEVGRALAGAGRRSRGATERTRPAAVEVTLDLEDWGEIRRLVEVAG